jgi:crotonobetainyl-CoA:carnitine CoA-transferase CaiB-like acyl-CoA transferase
LEVNLSQQEKNETMLSPFRVLDLTDEKGLYCGQLLGSLGADVIKIEKPGGDATRNIGPFYHDIPNPERSLFWFAFNTNKRGITLDIETTEGKDVFKQLVKTANVIAESFPPGYMDKLGLSYAEMEKINPGIVMTSITPFGQTGPKRDYESSDLICWAMGGLLYQTGEPQRPPVHTSHIPLSYLLGSMDGAWATVIALYWGGTSGKGQQVDVSIQQSVNKTSYLPHEFWETTGVESQRASTFYRVAGSDVQLKLIWPVKDGHIAFLIFGGHWGATHDNPPMVKWMDEEGMADDFIRQLDWENLNWRRTSPEMVEQIHDYFGRFFMTKTKAELHQGALDRRLLIQPVCTLTDILEHPQLKIRDYWQELEHPELGTSILYPARSCLSSETPCKLWRRAPLIGEHNREIYQDELGQSDEKVMAMKEKGII